MSQLALTSYETQLDSLKLFQKVQEEQLELQVLADVAIKIYAMTASLSRCNKSLLLSLRNCDYERFMCKSFISKTYRECYTLLDRLTRKFFLQICKCVDFLRILTLKYKKIWFSFSLYCCRNFEIVITVCNKL